MHRTVTLNLDLDKTTAQEQQAAELSKGFAESAQIFPKDSLGPALKPQATALAAAQTGTSSGLSRKGQILLRRWRLLDSLNSEEMDQHDMPGHVLDFKERRDRYLALLKQDLQEAWKKMHHGEGRYRVDFWRWVYNGATKRS